MIKGTVKFFNVKNKFGFIRVDETGQEIYVSASGLTESVKEGDRVEFDTREAKRGPEAFNVRLIRE